MGHQEAVLTSVWLRWRHRLTYLLMSIVVGWQALAIVISPAPDDSEAVQGLKSVLEPYLLALRMENNWGFFAPVQKQKVFRYIVEDTAGNEHQFTPQMEPARSLSDYVMWREFLSTYSAVVDNADELGDTAGALLCRRHAALHPVAVILVEFRENDFWREDAIRGKKPSDPEYLTVNPVRRVECPESGAVDHRSPARLARRP
jgi:hypothetical protein